MARRRWLSATVMLSALGVCAGAQTPTIGTNDITGRVVDARTNAPVANAVVTLLGHGAPDRVLTDDSGRFSFEHLPAGAFVLASAKPGFIGGGYAQRASWDLPAPLAIADGQPHTDVTLKLWHPGAIGGTITNDAHEPLANVQVQVLRRALMDGRWQWLPGAPVTTDDRGRYRIGGLDAATYIVAARPDLDVETPLLLALLNANPASAPDIMAGAVAARRDPEVDASVEHDAPAFYATAGARMTPIDVSGERDRIDIALARVRTVRVSGHVIGRAEVMESVEGLIVRLVPADAAGHPIAEIEFASTACDESGRFDFSAVPPGRYVMEALRAATPSPGAPSNTPLPSTPTLWGNAPLVVRAGTPVADATLRVETGRVLSGQIDRSDSATPPVDFSVTNLRLEPIDVPAAGAPLTWTGRASADGHFSMADVPPGRYVLRVLTLPRGLVAHHAMLNGEDLLDEPVTIAGADVPGVTIALSPAPLGSISGHADPLDTIVIFPQSTTLKHDSSSFSRRIRRARPASDGHFAIGNVPDGEYFAVALASPLHGDSLTSSRLQTLAAHAARVHVAGGDASTDPPVIK